MSTIEKAYRTLVRRHIADVDAAYVVYEGFAFSGALDALDGAVGEVEKMLGAPVSGIIGTEIQQQIILFRGKAEENLIRKYAEEDEWQRADEDEWDYAARVLKHPVAVRAITE